MGYTCFSQSYHHINRSRFLLLLRSLWETVFESLPLSEHLGKGSTGSEYSSKLQTLLKTKIIVVRSYALQEGLGITLNATWHNMTCVQSKDRFSGISDIGDAACWCLDAGTLSLDSSPSQPHHHGIAKTLSFFIISSS
jgi:hypothetical protein